MDKFERRILSLLQQDGHLSSQKLAERVGLSPSPCWRRVRRLEEQGIIKRYVALLDPDALGISVIAYVHVSLSDHHSETVDGFDAFVAGRPEILECYSVSGQYDYLLRVVAVSVAALEEFLMQSLLRQPSVQSANTSFVLKQKKYETALPIPD